MTDTPKSQGGKWADPQARSERAAKAGRAAQTPAGLITRLANMAGSLTDEDRQRLAVILGTPRDMA